MYPNVARNRARARRGVLLTVSIHARNHYNGMKTTHPLNYLTSTSSTSNSSLESGGTRHPVPPASHPAPRAPYPSDAGTTILRFPPTLIGVTPNFSSPYTHASNPRTTSPPLPKMKNFPESTLAPVSAFFTA